MNSKRSREINALIIDSILLYDLQDFILAQSCLFLTPLKIYKNPKKKLFASTLLAIDNIKNLQ